jgi:hypothetical protein
LKKEKGRGGSGCGCGSRSSKVNNDMMSQVTGIKQMAEVH